MHIYKHRKQFLNFINKIYQNLRGRNTDRYVGWVRIYSDTESKGVQIRKNKDSNKLV